MNQGHRLSIVNVFKLFHSCLLVESSDSVDLAFGPFYHFLRSDLHAYSTLFFWVQRFVHVVVLLLF